MMKRNMMSAAVLAAIGAACGQPEDARVAKALEQINGLEARVQRLEQQPSQRQVARAPSPPATASLEIRDHEPYLGSKTAKVTIVEAYEFACPYCAMLHPTVLEVLKAFPNDVRLVPRQFVVHPQIATDPALASCAAHKQEQFEKFTRALWKRAWPGDEHPRLAREALTRPALLSLAKELGLDRDRFERDLVSAECREDLQRVQTELASAGVRGTPTLFIDGERYGGPRTPEALKAAVARRIALKKG